MNDYKIADLTSKEYEAIKKAESSLNSETNKNFILIAWEKSK